jgi:hypothetical protein
MSEKKRDAEESDRETIVTNDEASSATETESSEQSSKIARVKFDPAEEISRLLQPGK